MPALNQVTICGNLTRDIDLRYTPNQKAVCDLGVAINEKVKNASGEWVDSAVFVDVTLWGRTAEIANEYLRKGSAVLIAGRLQLDTWEQDGQKRSKLKVVCDKMQMLGDPKGGNRNESQAGPTVDEYSQDGPGPAPTARSEDDIPF